MSWISDWLHPGRGYAKGQEELDKYYQQGQGYLNPYNQQGQDQYKNIQEYMKNLMNPQALQDQWAKGYKESDAAKSMEGLAQQHGLDAASSMGLMGSSPALQAIQAGTAGIAAQDKQSYMNDLMNKYMAGMGLTQNIYNTGAGAAGQQSANAMNMGQNSAGMAFGKQNAQGDLLSKLLGSGLGLFGGWMNSGGNNTWNTGGR